MKAHTLHVMFGAALALALVWIAFAQPTRGGQTALTFTVNSPSDVVDANPGDGKCETVPGNNVCTLRAAIMEANKTSGATINFGLTPPVTYTLSLDALVISSTLNIVGVGPDGTIIDGNATDRVITIITPTVSISGVAITNGRVTYTGLDPNAIAGGIDNNGTLTLTNVIVSGNSANSSTGAAYGGGIYSNGKLFLINSRVISNAVTTLSGLASGGGIIAGSGVTLTNSTISGNAAHDSGGGIFGEAALINSTLSGNTARNGGGIYGGELLLINSTISDNRAHDNGGGIYHSGGPMNLFNATLTGNMANDDASGTGIGGGVANAGGTVNFQNTIIGGNLNVIIVDGFPILNPEDCSGMLTSQGNNILSSTSDCTVNGAIAVADPGLGPLANNGGPTQTHALLPGSPAIDAGNPGGCRDEAGALLTTDQRGLPRPAVGCDIGAYELQHLLYLPLILR